MSDVRPVLARRLPQDVDQAFPAARTRSAISAAVSCTPRLAVGNTQSAASRYRGRREASNSPKRDRSCASGLPLPAARCLPPTAFCLPPAACCSSPSRRGVSCRRAPPAVLAHTARVTGVALRAAGGPPPGVTRVRAPTRCSPPAACCLLPAACCYCATRTQFFPAAFAA